MALRRRGPRNRGGHELFPGFTDVVEIGVGSLAVVFRAREIGTNRQVALKLLNVRDASPRSIESFERESIALGALSSHPNIVTLYRTFRAPDGRPVLVLELCSGAISDRLRNGAGLPIRDVVSIGVKIAGALETAHRAGILHRDVKPQNILVTEFGEPALADFGVAMLQSSTQTTAGLFDFTTLHAAPELLEGGGTSAATDVYELGSSLYQLITGQSAFRAYEGESPASVILRILRDPVRPLSGVDVPLALSDLLIRAMSKEKDERPPTALEFAAELAAVEITEKWHRTQFLIRDSGPLGTGLAPTVIRMPDQVPRGLAPAPAPSSQPSQLTTVAGRALAPAPPSGPPAHGTRPAPPAWSPPTAFPGADQTSNGLAALWNSAPSPPPPRHIPSVAAAPPTAADSNGGRWVAPSPVPKPSPEPAAQERPGRRRRHPVGIDDEHLAGDSLRYQPRHRPPPRPSSTTQPVATAGPAAVPVWAVRSPAPGEPQLISDLSLDPMSLRRRATLRSGASAVTVDEQHLRLRTWFSRTQLTWSDVYGFEANLDTVDGAAASSGHIVALTPGGPVELPGTRRPISELNYVHALLDAYRIRAQRVANG